MVRTKTKTEVATIKLTPQCREAWQAAATAETRSLANMFEVAILDYCRRHNVAVPTQELSAATTAQGGSQIRSQCDEQEG